MASVDNDDIFIITLLAGSMYSVQNIIKELTPNT